MTPETEMIFHAVSDLTPEARGRYFEENNVTPAIRLNVESLLRFDAGAADFAAYGRIIAWKRAVWGSLAKFSVKRDFLIAIAGASLSNRRRRVVGLQISSAWMDCIEQGPLDFDEIMRFSSAQKGFVSKL